MCEYPYAWINDFEIFLKSLNENSKEEKVELKINKNKTELKIILGQEPYKQKFREISLKVDSNLSPYKELNETIAFFTTEWIKIQDSLEMIFNLLFNGSVNGTKALAYLRENKIDVKEFADYLYKDFNIILINEKSNRDNIKEFIKSKDKDTYLLLVGCESQDFYKVISKSKRKFEKEIAGKIKGVINFIHPSGYNLNNKDSSNKLYKNWYELKSNVDLENQYIDKFKLLNESNSMEDKIGEIS